MKAAKEANKNNYQSVFTAEDVDDLFAEIDDDVAMERSTLDKIDELRALASRVR